MVPHALVTIRLPRSCWKLLLDPHTPVAMSHEIRTLLKGASWTFVARPVPHQEYVVDMLRLHAWQLAEHVRMLRATLAPADPRRSLFEQCLAAIEAGIEPSTPR